MAQDTNTLATEVAFRIANNMTTAQILPYLQRGLKIISAAASWMWDGTSATGIVLATFPATNLDPSKPVACFNTNGMPIVRVSRFETEFASANYTDVGAVYSTFRIGIGGSGPFLEFWPSGVSPGTGSVYYDLLPPTLSLVGTQLLWPTGPMDDLLVDFTEMELSRIYRWTDYEKLEMRCRARLIELAKIYSSHRQEMGAANEADNVKIEKAQGRD